jgi:hypothetical protein
MSAQPFQGRQKVVLEKRKADGTLDFSEPRPPVGGMTFDVVYRMFFRANPKGEGTWEQLSAWLASKSWHIRAKTW